MRELLTIIRVKAWATWLLSEQYVARLDGINVAFVGEATNVCHSWFEAVARLPIQVIQACPQGYAVTPDYLAEIGAGASGMALVTQNIELALSDGDVIYTDVWPRSDNGSQRRRLAQLFLPYQITADRLTTAKPNVLFLPCPPVHRGGEVSEDAMASPGRRVYQAKEYLLHVQNALLATLLGWMPA